MNHPYKKVYVEIFASSDQRDDRPVLHFRLCLIYSLFDEKLLSPGPHKQQLTASMSHVTDDLRKSMHVLLMHVDSGHDSRPCKNEHPTVVYRCLCVCVGGGGLSN